MESRQEKERCFCLLLLLFFATNDHLAVIKGSQLFLLGAVGALGLTDIEWQAGGEAVAEERISGEKRERREERE